MTAATARRGRRHSVSSTRLFLQCALAYKLQYLSKVRVDRPVPVHWRFGTVLHAALEAVYRAHAERVPGVDLDVSVNYPEGRAALDASWAELDMPVRGGEHDRAIGMLQDVLDQHEPLDPADVLGVEHKFLGSTPDGTLVVGYADLVLRLGRDAIEVRDHKVTSRVSKSETLASDYQLNTYGWLALQDWSWAEKVYVSHHYPPVQSVVRVLTTEETREDALAQMEATAEMIETETDFSPRVGDHCTSCAYRPQCPAWSLENEALRVLGDF